MREHEQEVLVVGRGIYALPMLRILGSNHTNTSGCKRVKVTLATSVGWTDVAAVSRCVDHVVQVPRADRDLEGFTTALCDIAITKPNMVVLPVGEETLFLSLPKVANRIQNAIPKNPPRILTGAYKDMMELNDKFQFQKCMSKVHGNDTIPQTILVHTRGDLWNEVAILFDQNQSASRVVVKPLSGHGSVGAHMIRREDHDALSQEELFQKYPVGMEQTETKTSNKLAKSYVVQEFVEGHEYSTLSLCLNGTVVFHVCYTPRQVGTEGFSPIRDQAPPTVYQKSLKYVQKVASSKKLTGHFGFDMMQRFNGDMAALECNPRVTNGLAFLSPRFSTVVAAQLKRLYLGSWQSPENNYTIIAPSYNNPQYIMTILPTVSCLAKAKDSTERMMLLEVAVLSYDDLWWGWDPLPFALMIVRVIGTILFAMAKIYNLPTTARSTRGPRKVSECVRETILDEVISFDMPAEASIRSTAPETVGGLQRPKPQTEKEKGLRVLVTGATGFLGGRVVRALHQGWDDKTIHLPDAVKSVTSITATGRNKTRGQQIIDSLENKDTETRFQAVDLCNAEDTYNLVKGHDVVIHCAALCALWTRWDDYISANVTATENITQACQLTGVKLLVHISSPSLCIPIDSDDRLAVKETDKIPENSKQANRYSTTKNMAESIVRDVSRRYNLPSITLRPRAIFGPGDATLFPLLLNRLKSGKLAIVGKGQECFGDFTYVDNVVAACLCCLDKTPTIPKIYAITNDDPRRLWDIIHMLCDKMNLKRPWKRIPRPVAYTVATFMEGFSALALLAGYKKEPLFTRYTVNVVSRSSTFDISAAKQDLGYRPVVLFDEGCQRFLDSLE